MLEALERPAWTVGERDRLVTWTRQNASLAVVSRRAAADLLAAVGPA